MKTLKKKYNKSNKSNKSNKKKTYRYTGGRNMENLTTVKLDVMATLDHMVKQLSEMIAKKFTGYKEDQFTITNIAKNARNRVQDRLDNISFPTAQPPIVEPPIAPPPIAEQSIAPPPIAEQTIEPPPPKSMFSRLPNPGRWLQDWEERQGTYNVSGAGRSRKVKKFTRTQRMKRRRKKTRNKRRNTLKKKKTKRKN